MEAEPEISETSRINHVVLGLPHHIESRISKKTTTTQKKLFEELNALETLVQKEQKSLKKNPEPKQEKSTHASNDD